MNFSGTTPVTTVPPVEAARRLRLVLKTAKGMTHTQHRYQERVLRASSRFLHFAEKQDLLLAQMSVDIEAIEASLRARKTAPGLEALASLRSRKNNFSQSVRSQKDDMRYHFEVLGQASSEEDEDEDVEEYDDNGNLIEKATGTLHQLLNEAYDLAQSFPTVEGLPTTAAENTLRAIIALLRHHRWPEVEGLTQIAGKEESNGKAEDQGLVNALEQLAAEAGKQEPVGADPH